MTAFSILLNKSAVVPFKSTRGLCQGDPLSPMIFILAAEVLTRMLLKPQERGFLSGFKVSKVGAGHPILPFANDTLILVDVSLEEARRVRCILVWFKVVSDLKVNTIKTILYQVNSVDIWESILNLWGCKVNAFPDVYLGLP